jgi:hypothetical protein
VNSTFQKLGIKMLATKLLHDYRECKASVPETELEHFSQKWFGIWVDADDEYKESVFVEFMRLLSE